MRELIYANKQNHIDLDVFECGTQICEPGHSFGPSIRTYYLIHYIHSGKGIFELDKKTYQLSEGQAFLICPNILAHYKSDMEDPWYYSWVVFHGTKAEYYLKQADITAENPVFEFKDRAFVKECCDKMLEAKQLGTGRDTFLLGLLYLLLSHHTECFSKHSHIEKGDHRKAMYIRKAISFIEMNFHNKINISDISRHVGLDMKYFCTLFSEQTKTSPYRYLIDIRLDKACTLLQNPLLSIGDISHAVGYEDQLMFSKIFKKYKGVSPRKYRMNC